MFYKQLMHIHTLSLHTMPLYSENKSQKINKKIGKSVRDLEKFQKLIIGGRVDEHSVSKSMYVQRDTLNCYTIQKSLGNKADTWL